MRTPKQTTNKWVERTIEQSTGLYCHWVNYSMPLTIVPNTPTLQTMGQFLNSDIHRWETWHEMREMMAAKGWDKSTATKFREYDAQYKGLLKPRWMTAWQRFSTWISDIQTATQPKDIRLSFGWQSTGKDCCEENLRPSRTVILEKDGRFFLAIMMKEGWYGWTIIQKHAIPNEESYNRIILSRAGKCEWATTSAEMINELVSRKQMCLFEIHADPIFKAVVSPENQDEKLAHLNREFTFLLKSSSLASGAYEFYMTYSVVYNPDKHRSELCEKQNPRVLDVCRERKHPWASRTIAVNEVAEVESAARWVVENDGCALIPREASDELRLALVHALFFVTFPDRPITAKGGLLNGYQVTGRIVIPAGTDLRADNLDTLVNRVRTVGSQANQAGYERFIDDLFERSCSVLLQRNKSVHASEALNAINARTILAEAAEKFGLLRKGQMTLVNGAALWMPDTSLAICFEKMLGLEGMDWKPQRLVQTTAIRSLTDSILWKRDVIDLQLPLTRLWRKGKKVSGWIKDRTWIARDNGMWYLVSFPKFQNAAKSLPYADSGVKVDAFSFVGVGVRSRAGMSLKRDAFEYNEMMKMAAQGRLYLYRIDVGDHEKLLDAVFSDRNATPCDIVTTVREFTDTSLTLRLTLAANLKQDGRKLIGREWNAYCDAYPEAKARPQIPWPEAPSPQSIRDTLRAVIRQDAVLMVAKDQMPAAIEAATCVFDDSIPTASLPVYQLKDRVFWDDGSGERKGHHRQKDKDKPLHEVIGESGYAEALAHFRELIAADPIGNAKTKDTLWLENGISIEGWDIEIERAFRRVLYTGTMSWRRQLIRPAHEVAVGIWMASLAKCHDTRKSAPLCPPSPSAASLPTPEQTARLTALDGLLAEGLITQDEYAAKKAEILQS